MQTTNLGLSIVEAAQSQKHVPVNESFDVLDVLVQLAVVSASVSTPPGSPNEGQRWIVPSGATGAWADHEGEIAAFQNGSWVFYAPKQGWTAFNNATSTLLRFDGSTWVNAVSIPSTTSLLGVNTSPDATNKFAVKSDAVLLSHDDVTPGNGNVHVVVNKADPSNDAGFVFQDNWSTRALFGLLADDDFTIKVSPDGSVFYEAVKIDQSNGQVSFVQAPKFSAYLYWNGPDQPIGADGWTKVGYNFTRHNDQNSFDPADYSFEAPADGYYLFGAKARFKSGGTDPTLIRMGFSVNFAVPNPDHMVELDPTDVPGLNTLSLTGLLKLSAGDKVYVLTYFTDAAGYIVDNDNYFWGCKIA